MTQPSLQAVDQGNLERLLPFVRDYHAFEKITRTDAEREAALRPLLGDNPYGAIWLISRADRPIGYIALCFGYSIEFGGRDAFVDEFFLTESERGRGTGRRVLELVKQKASHHGVVALHLEVAVSNTRARRFYETLGFLPRDRFHLMSCVLAG